MYRWMPLLARVLLSMIFIISGFEKLAGPSQTALAISAHGLPAAFALAILSGVIELGAGLALIFGCGTRLAAGLLFLYLIPVTFVMHPPHTMFVQFLKNLAIMGGLLMAVAFGAGPGSVDVNVRRTSLWTRIFGERALR